MKRMFLFLALCALSPLASPARADDQMRSVQQALKDQGFYYGQVDGEPGPETDAALRRYQIRQGLDVTGKLDQPTLNSLNLAAAPGGNRGGTPDAPPPAQAEDQANAQPSAPPEVVKSDHDFLRQQPGAPAASPIPVLPAQPVAPGADDGAAPPPRQAQPPAEPPPDQADAGQTQPAEYARFFRKTPYENAPPVVQQSTVQKAQARLAREGFYRGVVDGELSDAFRRALTAYQRDGDFSPSGRLDMETLADLNLLPGRHLFAAPPPAYGDYGPPAEDRGVYRGVWVH